MTIKSCDIFDIQRKINELEKSKSKVWNSNERLCLQLRIDDLKWVLDLMV